MNNELKLDLRDPHGAAKILKHSSSKGELAKLTVQYLTMANRLARLLEGIGKEDNWVVDCDDKLVWNGEGEETPPEIIPRVLKELGWVSGNRTNQPATKENLKDG